MQLPGRSQHLADRLLEALVGVGDNQLHPGQPALDQVAQELAPEGLGFALAAVEPDHLAPARLVHAVRDHQALADDAAAVAHLLHLGIEPQVGIAALERAAAEGVDLFVETGADAGDLRARDAQPERLDQLVDAAGGDAADVRLLDDRDEGLLAAPARLQEAREVAPPPQLRDRQLELAGARIPAAGPIAVALGQPLLGRPLAALGADQLGHLRLHQLLHDPDQRFAQVVDTLLLEQVADDLLSRHPLRLGHRGDSSRRVLGRNRRV